MEEQVQQPTPTQNPPVQSAPTKSSSKTLVFVVLSVFVLALVIFGVAFFFLNSDKPKQTSTPTKQSDEINTAADLDRAAKTLDSQDLNSLEKDLDANDRDATSF